jgi:hypothetical protein
MKQDEDMNGVLGEREQLLQKIKQAFADIIKPNIEDMFVTDWSYIYHLEEAKEAFDVEDWLDIPPETVFQYRDILSFLSPTGFRFVLPAFLTTCITHYAVSDVLPLNIQLQLTPPELLGKNEPEWSAEFERRMSGFNEVQRSTIREFLRFRVSMYPDEAIYGENQIIETIKFWDRY